MSDIEDLKERLEGLAKFRTAVRPMPLGVKFRDERDGQDRFDVIGHPCGIPIATFGDMNDAALFHFIAANADDLTDGITTLQARLEEAERVIALGLELFDTGHEVWQADRYRWCAKARDFTSIRTDTKGEG